MCERITYICFIVLTCTICDVFWLTHISYVCIMRLQFPNKTNVWKHLQCHFNSLSNRKLPNVHIVFTKIYAWQFAAGVSQARAYIFFQMNAFCLSKWRRYPPVIRLHVYQLVQPENKKTPKLEFTSSVRKPLHWHYNERRETIETPVILEAIELLLKSPVSRLFTQPFAKAQIQENIKAPRHWPNSPHKWPVTRKIFLVDDVIITAKILRWHHIRGIIQNLFSWATAE